MEEQAVQPEFGAEGGGVSGIKRFRTRRCQPFQLTHSRVGPLQNSRRRQLFSQHAHAALAHTRGEQTFGQELHDDQLAVLVRHQAGQLVCLTEAQATGVVLLVEHWLAPPDRRMQTGLQQIQPLRLTDRLARNQPKGNLRGRAIKRRAQKQSAAVGHGQQRGRVARGQLNSLNVGGVDPQMACAQPVGGAAVDPGSSACISLGILDILPLLRAGFLLNTLRTRRGLGCLGRFPFRSRPLGAGLGHGLP